VLLWCRDYRGLFRYARNDSLKVGFRVRAWNDYLTTFIYTHPIAVVRNGAGRAYGGDGAALVLAECDQEAVVVNPVLTWELLTERHFSIQRVFRTNIAETV